MLLRLVIALVVLGSVAHAQPGPEQSLKPFPAEKVAPEDLQIDLVTMGIGSLIWERHGHIAMCVTHHGLAEALRNQNRPDPEDRCYNYGIGDFHHPLSMTWAFFRGSGGFWVGKDLPANMMQVYLYFDRTIWVQPLPLNGEQKRKVIEKLEHDILPENRFYAYDHFDDNCTTRIRDIIDNVTGGALSSMTELSDGKTYRDLAREGFIGMKSMSRLSLIITDIAMGRSTDKVPTYYQRMFLPQFLREAVQKKFGIVPIQIYTRSECRGSQAKNCIERGVDVPDDGPSGRWIFAFVIILMTAPAWATKLWGRFERTGLAVAIFPYALLGAILTFLAIISPLPYVRMNETCLLLLPFDLAVVFLGEERRKLYARVRVGMIGVFAVLLLVDIFHQPLWAPLLWPLIPMATVGFWPGVKEVKAK